MVFFNLISILKNEKHMLMNLLFCICVCMLPHTCMHAQILLLKLLNELNDFNELWYKHCFPLNGTPTLYFEFPTIGKD